MNHNNNLIYKNLSLDVYDTTPVALPKEIKILNEYTTSNIQTGFSTKVYHNTQTNELIFSYRGTDSALDLLMSDRQMLKNGIPRQFHDADALYSKVTNIPKFKNAKITFTGHSVGGSLSQLMAKRTGHSAVTFAPYGTGNIIDKHPDIFSKSAQITNYGISGDSIFTSNINNQPGQTFVFKELKPRSIIGQLEDPYSLYYGGFAKSTQIVKSKLSEQHKLENYPDLDTAVEYDPTKIYLNENFDTPDKSGLKNGLSNSSAVVDALTQVPLQPQIVIPALPILPTTSVFGAVMGMVGGLISTVAGAALSSVIGGTLGNMTSAGVPTSGGMTIGGSASSGAGYAGQLPNVNGGAFQLNANYDYYPNTGAFFKYHTGGTVPGQGGVPALLRGGETVRTRAQEEELKQMLYEKYMGDFMPTVCGRATQPQRENHVRQANQQENKPIHQQITRDDEMFILNIICDAIDRNRNGLRTKIQAV
jgi:hypothetical protein